MGSERALHFGDLTISGLILCGKTPFSFVFDSSRMAGVGVALASAGGSTYIAITPRVRLH